LTDNSSRNISQPFVRLIQRVGEGALHAFRDNENAFDLLDHDGLLTEFYSGEVSYGQSYYYYQRLLEKITHRYPNMDVLEVGTYSTSSPSTAATDNHNRCGHRRSDTIILEP
jgi:hypothetical protein